MKETNSFVQFIADQMQGAGRISYRSMFGGYAFYCDRKVTALVCDNELFIKPTAAGKKFIGEVTEAPPYAGAKPYYLIQDMIDDKEWMCELIRLTAAELPFPKNKKPAGNISKKKNQSLK